jgi:VWFA-related protein
MSKVTFLKRIIVVIIFALYATPAYSQATTSEQEVIKIDTNLVILDAQVLNKKNNSLVSDLKVSDFELFEDNIRQEITHFSKDKLQLSVVLLLDFSDSVIPFIEKIGAGAIQALQQLKPEDEVAIIIFAGTTQVVQNFTKDHELIAQKIQELKKIAKVKSGTKIASAIDEATQLTLKATSSVSRRVIITVTDDESYDYRSSASKTIKTTLNNLFESETVVCGLIVRGLIGQTIRVASFYPTSLAMYKRVGVGTFADKTGGEMMNATKAEVDKKLGNLFEHLRTRYSIGYISTNTNYDGKFRMLSLKLSPSTYKDKGGIIIRTKQGYYARQVAKLK